MKVGQRRNAFLRQREIVIEQSFNILLKNEFYKMEIPLQTL